MEYETHLRECTFSVTYIHLRECTLSDTRTQVSFRYHYSPVPHESKPTHFCLCLLLLLLIYSMFFDNLFYVSKATVNSYQPYSRPFFSPSLPCHLPSSSLTPLPHLLVWLCDTLSLTSVACVTLGLDVCIGSRRAHHWVHSCRQWLCLPLKPAVSSCSSGRPTAWSPSWVDAWLLTGLVLWGPSVGNHGCCEIIFAMAVLCSEDNSLQPFSYIFSPVVFLPHLCP